MKTFCTETTVCTHPTRRRWSVEVNLFAVLSKASLVAPSHSQHIHAVHLQSSDHSTSPLHFIDAQPSCGRIRGSDATPRGRSSSCSPLVFNRKVPCWS